MRNIELKIKEDACFLTDKLRTISVSENGILPVRDIFSSIVDYGKVIADANRYYSEIGYPVNDSGWMHTNYELAQFVPEIKECQQKLNSLEFDLKMSGVRPSQKYAFFQKEGICHLITELNDKCFSGKYIMYEDSSLNRMKEFLLREVPAVFYEWWKDQQNGNTKAFDLDERVSNLEDIYSVFKESVGKESVYVQPNGDTYSGPQFGRELEMIFSDMTKHNVNVTSK